MTQTPRQKFAAALASGEMIQAPGCYDGLTAKLIERAGFQACYMTGAGTASSRAGRSPSAGVPSHITPRMRR